MIIRSKEESMHKIEFKGSQGETLAARLDLPNTRIKAYAIFAHCFTCSKDIFAASRIAKAMNEKGIAVLRFDFTGLGQSEGEFANTNFSSNVQDLVKAADYMREVMEAPSILIGHSLGGAAVLAAAKYIDEVKAVVSIGAPSEASHVSHNFGDKNAEILEKGEAEVSLVGRPFKIRKQFLEDIQSQNLKEDIANLKRALLVMHAPLDKIVGVEHAAEIFKAAKHPKSFVSLDDANHLLTRKEDAEYAANVVAAWVDRYIDKKRTRNERELEQTDSVIVTSTPNGKYQQLLRVGKHSFLADEPASVGGDDTGPSPFDLLNMALGACKSMTLRMYADRKKLPLDGVEVHVTHKKIDTWEGKLDQFECDLVIKGGELTDDQRHRLVEIADKCPVHKTISGEVSIITKERK